MNNTLETDKIKKKVPIPELVHKSLVAHGIITNPRVVKCGTYYSWGTTHKTESEMWKG